MGENRIGMVQAFVGVGGMMLVAIGVGFAFGWPGGVIAVGLLMFIGALVDDSRPKT
jgi:hypothetical protein